MSLCLLFGRLAKKALEIIWPFECAQSATRSQQSTSCLWLVKELGGLWTKFLAKTPITWFEPLFAVAGVFNEHDLERVAQRSRLLGRKVALGF